MLPEQLLGRLVHCIGIERLMDPPCSVAIQRRSLQPVEDPVTVAAGGRRETRMKRVVDRLNPGHTNIVRETAVRAQEPPSPAALASGIEVGDLPGCMHSGIGAARTKNLHGLVGDPGERFFETLLYAETGLLALPAVVRGSVVFDAERDANSSACD